MKFNRFIPVPPLHESITTFISNNSTFLSAWLEDLSYMYEKYVDLAISFNLQAYSVTDYILSYPTYYGSRANLPGSLINGLIELYAEGLAQVEQPECDDVYEQIDVILYSDEADMCPTKYGLLYDIICYVLTPTERLQFGSLDRDNITSRQLNLELKRLKMIHSYIRNN